MFLVLPRQCRLSHNSLSSTGPFIRVVDVGTVSIVDSTLYISVMPFLLQCRGELENHSVDAASTSEAVAFISLMQELKRKMHGWEASIEVK